MKPLDKAGFTIIETMLFLSISALLIMGILVGTGYSINVQRYRDSVTSFQSFLQQQFSEVSNVINDTRSVDCGSDTGINRGQSNCVILGHYITTNDSHTLTIKKVIGLDLNAPILSDDVAALQQYSPVVLSTPISTYTIDWGSLIKDISNNPMTFSILILRSPSSGIVRTFIDTSTPPIPDGRIAVDLIKTSALNNKAQFCIDSNGLLANKQMQVLINSNATNAGSIEILGDGSVNNLCH